MQTFADNPIKASEKEIDGMKNVGLLSLINVNIFTIKKRKFFHKIFQELS